ncbi:MAG: carbohydrate binding family 9 domain-containing protein [Chlorobi bacterium]|nr:carbohydrate binding family 9 domain-containing protein [Chlorobiota bacterium]
MIKRGRSAELLLAVVLCTGIASAQVSLPDTIRAFRITQSIDVDGALVETAWQKAPRISNFTQRELNEGQPVTERTEVAVLYDDQNLYIGVWCYDRNPGGIVAQKMKRDFDFNSDDNFEVIIDTYHDQRNSYLFVTNPNGARADALVLDNGRRVNEDWDGVWNVKTRITEQGWFAEFRIPFSTLRFKPGGDQIWGINFERNIRRKREQVLWQGWSRDSELEQVVRAGRLVGLQDLGAVTLVEVKPYGITGISMEPGRKAEGLVDAGADLNYLITPTMKLNLTLNTDFAQVESDRFQVNLTRFSLFYPEKREFFLEGRNYFDFSLGRSIQPFYTRKIGLAPDHSEVPIIGGARLLGKTGATTLGAMSIQTARRDTVPGANYTVLRWKQDILEESSVGVIGIGKMESNRVNGVYGADFLYSISDLFGDKNFSFGGAIAQSYTSDADTSTGEAFRFFVSYPNDLVEFDAAWTKVGQSFNPETGYLRRKHAQMYYAELQLNPRPAFIPWMRRLVFKPLDINYYIDDITGEMQSVSTEFRPLGFSTRSGEFFEFNIQRSAENPTEDFTIYEGFVIPAGEYWFTHYELQFGTFRGRSLSGFFFVNWGDFYDGTLTEMFVRTTWQINKHVSINFDYTRNDVTLHGGAFTVNEAVTRVEFAVNPDLFGAVFTQWNDEDNMVLLNFRVNWIPEPGMNFYFVVNQDIDTETGKLVLDHTTVLTKYVWRFVL